MSDKSSATGVVLVHPAADNLLLSWIDRTADAARSMRLSVAGSGPEPAVAATFDSAEHLHEWLDSDLCTAALSAANAEGVLRKSSDLLIVDGHRLPPGTAMFRHDVIESQTAGFIVTERQPATSCAGHPGFSSLVLLAPVLAAGIEQWTSVLSFRTDDQLATWLRSDERANRLSQLRPHLTKDFETLPVDAPFASILRIDDGRPKVTPRWKTAVLVFAWVRWLQFWDYA